MKQPKENCADLVGLGLQSAGHEPLRSLGSLACAHRPVSTSNMSCWPVLTFQCNFRPPPPACPPCRPRPDYCGLPKEVGPCRGRIQRFYYDAAKDECFPVSEGRMAACMHMLLLAFCVGQRGRCTC